MSVLVGKQTRLIVQGFTGSEGTFHAEQMIAYGVLLRSIRLVPLWSLDSRIHHQ